MSDINFREIDMDLYDADLTLVPEDPPYGSMKPRLASSVTLSHPIQALGLP